MKAGRRLKKGTSLCDAHLTLKSSAASLALSISSMIRAFSRLFFLTFGVNKGQHCVSSGEVLQTFGRSLCLYLKTLPFYLRRGKNLQRHNLRRLTSCPMACAWAIIASMSWNFGAFSSMSCLIFASSSALDFSRERTFSR